MQWRVIGPEKRRGVMNLALEEACMEAVGAGEASPTIFFYEWEKPAVIIGHFQKLHDEVDVDECGKHGVDIIRRITGGGAMYQDGEAMTFSMITPEALLPHDVNQAYRRVCGHIVDALRLLGIESEFKPINDIIVTGKKVSGSALTRRNGATMVHGTLLYTLDVDKMFAYLKVGRTKISDKGIQSVKERVTAIKHHKDVAK
ncbi:MAG: lipoate--protein ligase family protein, partial [Candidatus Aenigmarchaeota archaeon]|nr:lipoate--protein ligase family protein [Candidatus Aenigmarchaeota archaeon]